MILGKVKGMVLGTLKTIELIEADLQCVMRIHLKEMIEIDERLSKSN